MSNISEYLQITAKVKLLAEANYIMHIYNSSRSHDGFLFPILPEILKVSECLDDRLLNSI